jgi:hypothetical protein
MRALWTRSGLTIVAAIVLSAVLATAAAAKLAASWQLVDDPQPACFSPDVTSSYDGVWISGHWRRATDVGATPLPPGGRHRESVPITLSVRTRCGS